MHNYNFIIESLIRIILYLEFINSKQSFVELMLDLDNHKFELDALKSARKKNSFNFIEYENFKITSNQVCVNLFT